MPQCSTTAVNGAVHRLRPFVHRPPTLSKNHVHVWCFDINRTAAELPSLRALLSDEEAQRATRFQADLHRTWFIARRALLRRLLGWYLDRDPHDVVMTVNAFGKPQLAETGAALRFNASRAGGVAVVALTQERAIGVDIERLYAHPDHVAISERYFSTEETARLRGVDERDRDNLFFTLWTAKEAWVKALGGGLSVPLNQCRVGFATDRPPCLVTDPQHPGDSRAWSLRMFSVGDEHIGAIVRDGEIGATKLFIDVDAVALETSPPR
jgi:4'-phosphopantetheinyl transferase